MRAFAELYADLDASNSTLDKIDALKRYFASAPAQDVAHAVNVLLGDRPRRLLAASDLQRLVERASGLPAWLVEASYARVGDLAETCTLLASATDAEATAVDTSLAFWLEEALPALAQLDAETRDARVLGWWRSLGSDAAFVLNKLLTGGFRVGVARGLVVRALAELAGLPIDVIAHRLMGGKLAGAEALRALLAPSDDGATDEQRHARPYPFYLASPLSVAGEGDKAIGDWSDWRLEWKWDGIRAQLIHRAARIVLWSRGEERLDGRFPEIESMAQGLPAGTVLDGEILVWHPERSSPENFAALQTRINRQKPSAKLVASTPTVLLAYDLLECDGQDWRQRPHDERQQKLSQLVADRRSEVLRYCTPMIASDGASAQALRERARAHGVEGLMLKHRAGAYLSGRKRGEFWKWKLDPLAIDAVLTYAQAGHGRRANLYTDYTFALWHDGQLLTIAKAYSGLDDSEIAELDRWIRKHTIERFGPVRQVEPFHVFELGFEAVNPSKRHKSGVAVRFPRILRWRRDKTIADADSLATLRALADDVDLARRSGGG